jgi:glycosyltransferase involved in cell wall biosynthesis
MTRLSVLMSTYNDEAYICTSVESILNQSYDDFEFVIVDDGSTDATPQILEDYAKRDSRVVILQNERNLGAVPSLNKGLKYCHGRYLARQDGDDFSDPERFAKQIEFLDTHPNVGCVGTQAIRVNSSGESLNTFFLDPLPTDNESVQEILLHYSCILGSTVMVRRQSWEKAGYWYTDELGAADDYDLCLRVSETAEVANLSQSLYYYRQHQSSFSHRRSHLQALHKAMSLEKALGRRFGSHPPQNRVKQVASDYLKTAIMTFRIGERDEAKRHLVHALELYPSLLKSKEPLLELIQNFTPDGTPESKVEFTKMIFSDLFPKTALLTCIRSWLLSRLHMGEVFVGMREKDWTLINHHLWLGIQNDPSWLLNRGVVSIIIKSLFQRDNKIGGK